MSSATTPVSWNHAALMVVDMQRYYLEPDSPYQRFCEARDPGSLEYLRARCERLVIPNIGRLMVAARARACPVIFLRLCGQDPERRDLHPHFQELDRLVVACGLGHAYPLEEEPLSAVTPALEVLPGDPVFRKTTYSGFVPLKSEIVAARDDRCGSRVRGGAGPGSSNREEGESAGRGRQRGGAASPADAAGPAHAVRAELEQWLRAAGVETLVMTGLATSQCVETTARDASDRGFSIVQVEDAQADYDDVTHRASLYSSRGVCGGMVLSTRQATRA